MRRFVHFCSLFSILAGLLLATGAKRTLLWRFFSPSALLGRKRGGPTHYLLAVLLVASATVLQHLLVDHISPGIIFIIYVLAVMIVALAGGLGPGILATGLSAACVDYFFLAPKVAFTIATRAHLVEMLMFIVIGVSVSWLASSLEQAREEAATALRQSENELRQAQHIAHIGSWKWDAASGASTWSDQLCEIFGLDSKLPPPTSREPHLQFTRPEGVLLEHPAVQQALEAGQAYEFDLEIVLADGTRKWVIHRGAPDHDAEGRITGLHGTVQDITERKRTEEIMLARFRLAEYALTHSLDELLRSTLDEVERLTGSSIGFFHFLEADQKTLSLQTWSTRTLNGMCTAEGKGRHYSVEEGGVWVDCVRQRRPVIHNDYAALPSRRGLPEGHAEVIREMVVPIFRGDQIVAILGVGNKLQPYQQEDIRTATLLADLAWEIAERKRAEHLVAERARQQQAVASLGQFALSTSDPQPVMELAVSILTEVLKVEYSKVLELLPDGTALHLRAGMGWNPGVVGHATVGAGIDSQAGYTLLSADPVVVNDLRTETRFSGPQLLHEHGVTSGMSVVISEAAGRPFGVLGAHTKVHREFNTQDVRFLQEIANILAQSIIRSRAEATLAAERQKFNHILDVLSPYVVLLTPDYHVAFANQEFRRRFGESNGRRCYEFLFNRTEPCEICETYKVLKTGQKRDWEWTGPDSRSYEIHDFPFNDTDGQQLILEMGIDITERKQAEKALTESEEKLRIAMASGKMGAWDLDILHDRAWRSIEHDQIFGYQTPLPEWSTEIFLSHVISEDREFVKEKLQEAYRTGSLQFECRIHRQDAALRWIAPEGRVSYDDHGKPVRMSGLIKDVTDQKMAELALRESEASFSTLANFVPQLVWICMPDGLNIYFNQRWVDYTGLTLQESYGQGWSTPFHPDDKQAAWDAWNHAVATGDTYRVESRLRAADGAYRWFLMRGTPLRDASGQVSKWFGTCTDIDDLKRAEQTTRDMNVQLEARVQQRTAELIAVNKELESFNYAVAHDLRGPLRHIFGFTSLLAEEAGPNLDESSRKRLQRIQDSVKRMAQLLEDLLDLARLGRQELRKQVCDLNALVKEVVATLQPDIQDRKVEWRTAELPSVQCDPTLMKQVLVNLLSNALKFTRTRHPAIIEVGCTKVDGEPAIFVRDNGVGFSMKFAHKLFGLFQRLHREEDFEGTGIGLAIVQRILQRHGGRTWVDAELNKGATFYFCLPTGQLETLEDNLAHIAGTPVKCRTGAGSQISI